MKCSEELAPNWLQYTRRGTLVPGLQPLLLLSGIDGVEAEGLPGITWTCHGDYEVKINGGGLLAEEPVSPPLDYYTQPLPPINPWSGLALLGEALAEPMEEPALVNPLSWDPIAPLTLKGSREGPPGCVTDGENSYYFGRLDPLRATKLVRCARLGARRAGGAIQLGHLRLLTRGARRGNNIEVLEAGGCLIVRSASSLTISGYCRLRFDTNLWEYRLGVLYPSCFYKIRASGERIRIGPVPALTLGLHASVAMASRNGVEAVVEPGRVEVNVRGSLRLNLAGEAGAYRLFVEDLVAWRVVKAPRRGYGNTRSSHGVMVLVGAGPGELRFSLSNPLPEAGMAEARLPYLASEAVLDGPYGEEDIPVRADLVRVPLPPGFHGCLRVKLSGEKKLLRIIRGLRGR